MSLLDTLYTDALSIANMERARTATPGDLRIDRITTMPVRVSKGPVDGLAYLAGLDLRLQCELLAEAYSEVYGMEDPAMVAEFLQFIGSKAGQRMLKYIEQVARS